jgi:hypothetical protein
MTLRPWQVTVAGGILLIEGVLALSRFGSWPAPVVFFYVSALVWSAYVVFRVLPWARTFTVVALVVLAAPAVFMVVCFASLTNGGDIDTGVRDPQGAAIFLLEGLLVIAVAVVSPIWLLFTRPARAAFAPPPQVDTP